MRPALHVIGPSPAWANPGEASACYLVEAGGARMLLDCGSGAVGSLRARDPEQIDAILISHLHHDHVADIVPLAYGLTYGVLSDWPRVALWLPPGGSEALSGFTAATGAGPDFLARHYDLAEYDPAGEVTVGEARVTFADMPHPGICRAMRIEAGGGVLCYSGDTSAIASLVPLAGGADVLVCEATLADGEPGGDDHITARQAGDAAREAGCGQLVLAHVEHHRRDAAVAAARSVFPGPVAAAVPGLRAQA